MVASSLSYSHGSGASSSSSAASRVISNREGEEVELGLGAEVGVRVGERLVGVMEKLIMTKKMMEKEMMKNVERMMMD